MIQTITLFPGVKLRCFRDSRFKHGCLSIQLIRPMDSREAAMNALLPSVLLRGTQAHPDIRSITMALDDLYGASVSDLVRRIGDHQAVGFFCSFPEDRFALPGDEILAPLTGLLEELLLRPLIRDGAFREDFVQREKEARITDLEADYNDKPLYAAQRLLRLMCAKDSFGIPRMGDKEQVRAISNQALYDHYRHILRTAPVEFFYVGAAQPEQVAELLRPIFAGMDRQVESLPAHTPFRDAGCQHAAEESDTAQSILNMGFVTPITNAHPDHVAMRLLNAIFGAGMTSKLFLNVREKMSLCYSIGSDYYAAKGILTVAAGIDGQMEQTVRKEILAQLDACREGNITDAELEAAREALLSGLRSVHDSPGAIENYYSTQALSGIDLPVADYRAMVAAVTKEDVVRCARSLRQHSSFFLKGVGQ